MTVLLISLELQISLHLLFLLLLSEPLIHIARSLTCIIGKIPISASPAHFFVVFNWKLIPLILPSAIRLGWPSPDGVVPSGRALKKHKTSLTRKKTQKKKPPKRKINFRANQRSPSSLSRNSGLQYGDRDQVPGGAADAPGVSVFSADLSVQGARHRPGLQLLPGLSVRPSVRFRVQEGWVLIVWLKRPWLICFCCVQLKL